MFLGFGVLDIRLLWFYYPHLNFWFLLVCWRLELNSKIKEKNVDEDSFLNSNFIAGFNKHSVDEENLSWNQYLSDKVLKHTNRFRGLISPKSVSLGGWFRWCRLASSRHGVRLLNIIFLCLLLAAEWKSIRYVLRWSWTERIPFLCWDGPFSGNASFQLGTSGNFWTPWIYFILFILFYFFFYPL